MTHDAAPVIWFERLGRRDVPRVGGKNASLGEMVGSLAAKGIRVPPGFAMTAEAYWRFIDENELKESIASALADLTSGKMTLAEARHVIRRAFRGGEWPKEIAEAIASAYGELCRRTGKPDANVAVRSSATAEDLPDASFAGQQETYLNIRGERALLDACKRCYASLFNDRALSYALSVGVQRMVRADVGGAGVMFSIDTETGFDKVVLINATFGRGQG